jgi:E3 ubiquitin-protein ligase TRIP12
LQELDLYDILSFDLELGTILLEMQAIVGKKQFLEAMPGDNRKTISELCFRDARIEDLCLDFTLPGYPEYALKTGESDTMVCFLSWNFSGSCVSS